MTKRMMSLVLLTMLTLPSVAVNRAGVTGLGKNVGYDNPKCPRTPGPDPQLPPCPL